MTAGVPDKFRGELLAALHIVERGDMAPGEMRGAWAGEIGQTQFLPSSYLKYAVDYDGNGRRDLIHSVPDALASTANYLKGMAGSAASHGAKVRPTSRYCCSGTRRRFTRGPSPISPSSSRPASELKFAALTIKSSGSAQRH